MKNDIKILKAMANDKRLKILKAIARKELCVDSIIKIIKSGQSSTSQNLRILRDSGVVKTRRDAQTIYYSLNTAKVSQILKVLMEK